MKTFFTHCAPIPLRHTSGLCLYGLLLHNWCSNRMEFRFMNFKNTISFVFCFRGFPKTSSPSHSPRKASTITGNRLESRGQETRNGGEQGFRRNHKNVDHFAKNSNCEGL